MLAYGNFYRTLEALERTTNTPPDDYSRASEVRLESTVLSPSSEIAHDSQEVVPSCLSQVIEKVILSETPTSTSSETKQPPSSNSSHHVSVKSLPPDTKRKWNEEYQQIFDEPASTPYDLKERSKKMSKLIQEYIDYAQSVAQVIVEEVSVTDLGQRQLKPADSGGKSINYLLV